MLGEAHLGVVVDGGGGGEEDELRVRIDLAQRLFDQPAPDAGADAFHDYVYMRTNPKGWHVEWWHHVGGCRQWIKVARHTVTHEIRGTATATGSIDGTASGGKAP